MESLFATEKARRKRLPPAMRRLIVDEMRRPTPYAVPCEVCKWLRTL
jgi:hypothetical protein